MPGYWALDEKGEDASRVVHCQWSSRKGLYRVQMQLQGLMFIAYM